MTAHIVKLPARKRKLLNTKPLTALRVKNHKFGIISDAHPYQGLRIRANKNGTKTWMYRYRSGDKLKQIKLGTYPGMELAEAREALTEQKKLKEQHQDPRRVALQKKKEAEALEALESKQVFTFSVKPYNIVFL